jgi:hypothetical protein
MMEMDITQDRSQVVQQETIVTTPIQTCIRARQKFVTTRKTTTAMVMLIVLTLTVPRILLAENAKVMLIADSVKNVMLKINVFFRQLRKT